MKHLLFETGGRPLNNDDFTVFQDEIYYAVNGQFLGLPACVVFGCEVDAQGADRYNIGHGLVYIDGEVRRFAGASDVALPQELYTAPFETTELRAYQTGGSKATMGEAVVLARPYDVAAPGSKVLVRAEGVLRVSKAREALFRAPFEMGMVADFPAEYDATGRGKYGTNAFGWALCNGQNNTPDMGGRFVAGYGGPDNDYNGTRKKGGVKENRLTVPQLPEHTHTMDSAGQHRHKVPTRAGDGNNPVARRGDNNTNDGNVFTDLEGAHTHYINPVGNGEPIENRPPYMTVAFRMWVGF